MRDARGSVQALTSGQAAVVDVSAAIASADAASVERESARAIDASLPPAALYEVLLQSYLFVGFPRAIEALFAARPILEPTAAIPPAAAPADPSARDPSAGLLCPQVYA